MATSFSLINTPTNCLFTPKRQVSPLYAHRSLKFQQLTRQTGGRLRATGCETGIGSSTGAVAGAEELERKLENEIGSIEEWIGVTGKKCRDRNNGIVELLECLETEAIMGDDQGKEPMDYNRRAHIFDKSSIVFQAIKEHINQ